MTESLSFERVADEYDQTRGGLERGRRTAQDAAPHLVSGLVLEVGIGTGAVGVGLRERGFTVCGVDLSAAMAHRARQRLGQVVALADAGVLPVRTCSVANVVCAHVLHLVSDMHQALSEAARVLQPGGRLVAVHGNLTAEPDDVIDTIAPLGVLQQRPDTPAGLTAACRAAGLVLVMQRPAVPHERDTAPAEFAAGLAARSWPYLWRVDDQTWAWLVEPVIAALRALPDPDRPRHQIWRASLSVLAKPTLRRLCS